MLKLRTFHIKDWEEVNKFVEKQPPIEGGIQTQGEYVIVWYSEEGKLSASEAIEIVRTNIRKIQQNMLAHHADIKRLARERLVKTTKSHDDQTEHQMFISKENIASGIKQIKLWEDVIEDLKKGEVEGFK